MNLARLGFFAVIGIVVFLVGSCTIGKAFTVVEPGNVGVKIRKLSSPAVSPTPVQPGLHFNWLGESIVQYPTIQRTYTYTKEPDERGDENEEITFSDKNALPMTADVQIVLRVNPAAAPALYQRLRLNFDQLFDGPVRNDVRTAIAAESEQVPVEFLYSGGRQQVISRALARVRAKWAPLGVEISQLDWIGNIRYPPVILNAIQEKTKADAQVKSAQARVAVATANAAAQVETARGQAEATRLQAEALRANPEILRQKEIERWRGICPLDTNVCIVGANAPAIVGQ